MEAFMYRCHPQTKRLCELVASGAIGEVRMIQATFSFQSEWNPESRLLNKPLGGGGILDVGCYCASMARMVAGAASGQPFAEPTELKAVGRVGETGVDEWTAAVLRFPGDIVAQLSCGVQLSQENVVRIYGSAGNILVPSPWFCGQDEAGANIVLRRGNETERISFADHRGLYAMEADTAAESIANGALEAYPPAMTWDDSVGNMRVLDRWRKELGV
jgi:predicted dehydrogenase